MHQYATWKGERPKQIMQKYVVNQKKKERKWCDRSNVLMPSDIIYILTVQKHIFFSFLSEDL